MIVLSTERLKIAPGNALTPRRISSRTQTPGASLLEAVNCLVASSALVDAVASGASKGAQASGSLVVHYWVVTGGEMAGCFGARPWLTEFPEERETELECLIELPKADDFKDDWSKGAPVGAPIVSRPSATSCRLDLGDEIGVSQPRVLLLS